MKMNDKYFIECFDTPVEIEAFKKDFHISDEEWTEALKEAFENEYGTQDLKFNDEAFSICIEVDDNEVKHIYDLDNYYKEVE